MILTDYLKCEHDICWDFALQCGVKNGVIRLPETKDFDICDFSHWQDIKKRFTDFGIKPIIIEPMPNELHDHIKSGDKMRDESIEKLIKMMSFMDKLDIRNICFNFMAHTGWLRTTSSFKERGGALVTAFDLNEFTPTDKAITQKELWDNYEYFLKAVVPYAEKYNIKLALHPDDPPLESLGNVERIMISYENIKKAIYDICPSPMLGVCMCQACYLMMGEDLNKVISEMKEKIFFVHFRNVRGNKYKFNETFHDNGEIDMAKTLKLYKDLEIDVPIRVDHVPLMAGENEGTAGYTALGRLYAIGYLKGLMESLNVNS